MSLWAVLLTGLVAGGVSCAAVQGGLLAAVMARRSAAEVPSPAREFATTGRSGGASRRSSARLRASPPPSPPGWSKDVVSVGSFLSAKLGVHTLLGAALGALGASVQLGPRERGLLQIAAAVLLGLFALDLLGVRFVRQLLPAAPASWTRLVRRSARWDSALAPGLLGVATVLVPCGVTLSMEFLAIASGSPVRGAAIMGAFVLGTMPLFALIGMAARHTSRAAGSRRLPLTGVAVLVAAVLSLNAGLVLLDSPWAPSRVYASALSSDRASVDVTGGAAAPGMSDGVVVGPDGVQRVTIAAKAGGYSPSTVRLRAGIPTKVTFHSAGSACTNVVVIPSLKAQLALSRADREVDLGTPQPGTVRFTCGMGMDSGKVEVIA